MDRLVGLAVAAKQAATVQQIVVDGYPLGVGVGWREADYTLSGRDLHKRGRTFDTYSYLTATRPGVRSARGGDSRGSECVCWTNSCSIRLSPIRNR